MAGQHRLCGGTSRLLRGACPLHPWPSLGPLSGVRGQWRRETGGSGKNESPSRLGSLADLCYAFKKEVLWVPPQFLHHPSSPPLHHLSSPSLHHPCSPSLHHPSHYLNQKLKERKVFSFSQNFLKKLKVKRQEKIKTV